MDQTTLLVTWKKPESKASSTSCTGGITTADIYTNEYIDPSIGFIADGTTLDLSACPDDWDPEEGVTDTEIRLGTSLPQSGQLAGFGTIATGMQYYFDYVNATKPIDEELEG